MVKQVNTVVNYSKLDVMSQSMTRNEMAYMRSIATSPELGKNRDMSQTMKRRQPNVMPDAYQALQDKVKVRIAAMCCSAMMK